METIEFNEFTKVELRVGTIIEVNDFPQARKASYKLKIDFGDKIGIKNSSAQITNYKKEDLIGKQVICVINFKPMHIADFKSEVLTTGFYNEKGEVILSTVNDKVPNGSKIC